MKTKRYLGIVATAVTLTSVICLDVLSNSNSSRGESMLFWEITMASILMFFHGAVFAFCVDKGKRLQYVVISAAAIFTFFFITRLYMDVGPKDSALSGAAAVALFLPSLCIGLLVGIGVSYVYNGIKKNGNLLKYRYRK